MIERLAALNRVVGLLKMHQDVINALLDQVVEVRFKSGRSNRGAAPFISDDPVRDAGQAVTGEVRT